MGVAWGRVGKTAAPNRSRGATTENCQHTHKRKRTRRLPKHQQQGKGEGLIRLGLQYRALDAFTPSEVSSTRRGLLLVGVLGAKSLASSKGDDVSEWPRAAAVWEAWRGAGGLFCKCVCAQFLMHTKHTQSKPTVSYATLIYIHTHTYILVHAIIHIIPQVTSYVKVKVGKAEHKTPNVAKNASPRWYDANKFTFYGVGLEVRDCVCVERGCPDRMMMEVAVVKEGAPEHIQSGDESRLDTTPHTFHTLATQTNAPLPPTHKQHNRTRSPSPSWSRACRSTTSSAR